MIYPFPHYQAFTTFTPTIPTFYWDTYSQEERIKALCKEYAKLVAFTDSMVDTVNEQYDIINALSENFPSLVEEAMIPALNKWAEDGSLRIYIDEQIAIERARIDSIEESISSIEEDIDELQEYLTPFTGATSFANGEMGLVPAPSAGDNTKFLSGAGTWETVQGGGGAGGVGVDVDGTHILASAGTINFISGDGVVIDANAAGATARVTVNVDTDALNLATVATTGNYNDLNNKPTIPAAQVQSDWAQTDVNAIDYIKNKPETPAAQVQSDWNQSNVAAVDYIKNKPSIVNSPSFGSNALITSGGVAMTVNELQNKINEIAINSDSKIVCIGDSFLTGFADPEGTQVNWGACIANITGATVYNYDDSGSGFTMRGQTTNTTFAERIARIYADHPSDIDTFIIGGGYNDCMANKTKATIKSGATALLTNIYNYYPDAKVYIFPNLWGNGNNSSKDNSYSTFDEERAFGVLEAAQEYTSKTPKVYMGNWTWLYGNTSGYVSADNVHPLTAGEYVIAHNMVDSIAGKNCIVQSQSLLVEGANGNYRFVRNYLNTSFIITGASVGNKTIFQLPYYMNSTFAAAPTANISAQFNIAGVQGDKIIGWYGNSVNQYTTINSVLSSARDNV